MADEKKTDEQKIATPEEIETMRIAMLRWLSEHRNQMAILMEEIFQMIKARPACTEELVLSLRELQSSRHWMGECMAYFPTPGAAEEKPSLENIDKVKK